MNASRDSEQRTGSLTAQEMPKLLEQHVAQAQLRQAESDASLLKVMELGAALKRLAGR